MYVRSTFTGVQYIFHEMYIIYHYKHACECKEMCCVVYTQGSAETINMNGGVVHNTSPVHQSSTQPDNNEVNYFLTKHEIRTKSAQTHVSTRLNLF